MKILIVGDFHSKIEEYALYKAFLKLGYNVHKFAWCDYFQYYLIHSPNGILDFFKFLYYRFQNKFLIGPVLKRINSDLIAVFKKFRPDLVFVYHGTHIFPSTLGAIKREGAMMIFGFNNDDPFGGGYPHYFWRHFLRSVHLYDHMFAFRHKNIEDYENVFNYRRTSLLRASYVEGRSFPMRKLPNSKYMCDVIFVGHYEDDGRDVYIKTLIESGIDFKLYGPEWERSKFYALFKEHFGEIHSLVDDYNLALNSSKIALVFLSKLNNDTYTKRCFEITAAGTFMLSEYSNDLNSLFKEDEEAVYFRNKEEMVKKIQYYLKNGKEREKIAQEGYRRLKKDGHEIGNRAKEIIRVYNKYRAKKT